MSDWMIFKGNQTPPHDRLKDLPAPPVWRSFGGVTAKPVPPETDFRSSYWRAEKDRGERFRINDADPNNTIREAVNAALYLRRPLLLTGRPGTGKSSLIYAVAHELQMGPVLKWSITSRSTLKNGLYEYDALERLREVQSEDREPDREPDHGTDTGRGIGKFFTLGPLGTALYPTDWPRALLIDEIDKADLDLPNDLLNIFEDGRFGIPELERYEEKSVVSVNAMATQNNTRLGIEHGRVQCRQFPFVVLTSNGEREFPGPFLRRCIRIRIDDPTERQLAEIVEAHLGSELRVKAEALIADFAKDRSRLATDQLLNAVYMTAGAYKPENSEEIRKLRELLMKHLQ
jgi:MoxR-like ATPase